MIKILIVDDEKPICDLIDLNLSAAGYFCKSVQDGMKAIELIEKETFDLILLDIMLPGVDGFDIMEYIRPLKIPVIFITAKGDVKDRALLFSVCTATADRTTFHRSMTVTLAAAICIPASPMNCGAMEKKITGS